MDYSITKSITFCAAHRLLDYNGRCSNIHGHNYKVEATITDALMRLGLSKLGMICDFGDLKQLLFAIVDEWDHRLLLNVKDNLIADMERLKIPVITFDANPTAEHMARVVCERLTPHFPTMFVNVRVWETETSYAEVK